MFDSPAGSLVNEEGCPVEKVSVSLNVKFETGKIAVASKDDAQFQKVADFMKSTPNTTVLIEGHSDNVGSVAMNKVLSQKRADAIRNVFVWKFGITADRVSAKGFGSESPIADNKTPEGRAANRRVVAVITADKKMGQSTNRILESLVLASTLCGGLLAADATDRFAIGGAGGWGDLQARDDAQLATNGDLFGSGWIRIGVSLRNEFILGYDSIHLKVKNDSDATRKRIRPITAGLWTSLLPECRLTPVVTVGVGVATLNGMRFNGNKSQPALATQGGLGVEYFPTSSFSVGSLVRVHYVASPPGGDRTEATAVTLGLMANMMWGGENSPSSCGRG